MKKQSFKIFGTLIGIILAAVFFTKLLHPTWPGWNIDNTVKGIYKEPKDRIQIVFLGNSGVVNGISPVTLYNHYGFCAYNMGIPSQPLLSSYYWLKEIYSMHSKTLKTVVLDVSFAFFPDGTFEQNEKALTYMHFSPVKREAYRELAEKYGIDPKEYLIPLTAYHSRWTQVSENDFSGLGNRDNYFYTRGQNAVLSMALSSDDLASIEVPNYGITPEQERTPDAYKGVFSNPSQKYFSMIRDFCREHQLDLVLIKIPHPSMNDLYHDAVQYLADENGIPFIDFNLPEIQEKIGLDFATDFQNPTHPNIHGAEKISDHIGAFLRDTYTIPDVREDPDYDYLALQAEEYSQLEENARLLICESLEEYMDLINNEPPVLKPWPLSKMDIRIWE